MKRLLECVNDCYSDTSCMHYRVRLPVADAKRREQGRDSGLEVPWGVVIIYHRHCHQASLRQYARDSCETGSESQRTKSESRECRDPLESRGTGVSHKQWHHMYHPEQTGSLVVEDVSWFRPHNCTWASRGVAHIGCFSISFYSSTTVE